MTDTDERYTPPEVIAMRDAVWVLGTDTDPAWHPRSFSRARVCYTKRDNGLVRPWYGRVWLNPPWSDPTQWIDLLLRHVRQLGLFGEAAEALLLVRNDPSTAWWSTAWKNASAIAFLSERTRYYQLAEDGDELELCGTPSFTSVVFYYGPDVARFVETAEAYGHCAVDLRNHSKRTRMPRMAKGKPLPDDVLGEMLRDTIAQYARAHPERTLRELSDMIPTDAGTDLLLDLQVRDLWPDIGGAPALPAANGNGHAKLSPERTEQVDRIQKWISKAKLKEFRAVDVMTALGVSRQTALRALQHVPNIRAEGKAKNARYVVT